jgi:hypothetical protein
MGRQTFTSRKNIEALIVIISSMVSCPGADFITAAFTTTIGTGIICSLQIFYVHSK